MEKIEFMEALLVLTLKMREAQNRYFAAKKASGVRYPTPEVKRILDYSKRVEAGVDAGLKIYASWADGEMHSLKLARAWRADRLEDERAELKSVVRKK